MKWLWALGILAVLLFLLCRTRVGIWTAFGGGEALRLDIRLGLLRLRVLPAKAKKTEKQKKPKKESPPKKKKPEAPEKPERKLSFTLEDGKDALRTLFPPLKRALGRTRRGLRIFPLRLSVILGGQAEPADSAQLYGELQAALWAGMPVLERLLDIPDPQIHIGIDFQTAETAAEGEVGASFRIGTLLAVGFGMAFPALRWFLRWRKRCKTRPPKLEKRKKPDEMETKPETPEAAETGTH